MVPKIVKPAGTLNRHLTVEITHLSRYLNTCFPFADAINDAGDVFVVSTESIRNSCDNTDHNYSITVQEQAEVEILQENTDPLDAGHKDLVILSNSGQVLETNPSFVEVINEQTTILQGRVYQY